MKKIGTLLVPLPFPHTWISEFWGCRIIILLYFSFKIFMPFVVSIEVSQKHLTLTQVFLIFFHVHLLLWFSTPLHADTTKALAVLQIITRNN